MSQVDLGFSQQCAPWEVESYLFPSKIGGKPAWLDLENLPSPEKLQCASCTQPLTFLCQVYAPYEEDPDNFHRTIFIFICRKATCCTPNSNKNVKVFRCSLPRENKFYASEAPEHKERSFGNQWVKLCAVCGCLGAKKCAKCKNVTYCSREHQVVDWKEGHREECERNIKGERQSQMLFPQSEIVIEAEEIRQKSVNENDELKKYQELKREGKTGTMSDVADSEMEKYAIDQDKAFARFRERIAEDNDQVLRYERAGEPLWIASGPKPDHVPDCELCHSERQFEFQVMPQIFSVLGDNELDVGVLAVYTCKRSCVGGDRYKSEFVFKQDVANCDALV